MLGRVRKGLPTCKMPQRGPPEDCFGQPTDTILKVILKNGVLMEKGGE